MSCSFIYAQKGELFLCIYTNYTHWVQIFQKSIDFYTRWVYTIIKVREIRPKKKIK